MRDPSTQKNIWFAVPPGVLHFQTFLLEKRDDLPGAHNTRVERERGLLD